MSLYSQRLAKLKTEIQEIKSRKSKKRFKKNQQIMINFINGVTSNAQFRIKNQIIMLYLGDSKKGFKHIIERHYCKNCDGEITAMDILNLTDIIERGLKLAKEGVTNDNLIVYQKIDRGKNHKIVLKPVSNGNFIVTMYSIK